ncbi:Panacea domain-containing protein [Xenorhabdus indica]|uniref:Panacea domain-containing protein n=1 Tax=Xenorhabdus indica TaxID=333964 RepID=UPI0016569998|nr:type II toxin-antitoxin system antitoxin SocA domain-containing protein [Xenorhabdus indica]MBC8947343.1 phage-associated protein [Xenorhabdus indica]
MPTCFDVADYFLACCNEESGDTISNLKLQKLVYYAQGFSLALLKKPLFKEQIEAWMHGPVVPAIYRKYKEHGNQALPIPTNLDLNKFSDDEKGLLNEVYDVFGQFSAWKLRNMTHEEAPWKNNYIEGVGCQVISHEELKDYFLTRIN